jgi:hypothetical protein
VPALDSGDLAKALKTPEIQQVLARLLRSSFPLQAAINTITTATAHAVTVGDLPGVGSGQNDTFVNRDNVDLTHPISLSYLIPSNSQRVMRALLSWRLHAYRTYNTLSVSATGTESVGHTHASAAHNHNHGHNMAIGSGGVGGTLNMVSPNGPLQLSSGGPLTDTTTVVNDATSTTPGSTGGVSANHTHNVSASGVLGITEGTTATNITLSFDGVDQTAALGGPWNTDVVELDVTQFLTILPLGAWHTIALSSATLGQIESHLRVSFYSNSAAI